MKYVAIGCDDNPNYSFLIPLTSLFWRYVVGYTPVVLLVGDKEWHATKHSSFVLDKLHEINDYYFIERAEGYPSHTTAQNCRLYVTAMLPFADDEWIMLSDADLWPLRREFYQDHIDEKYRLVSLYANGDHFVSKADVLKRVALGHGTQTLPICNVAMRARDWRAIFQPIPGDVAESVKKMLDGWMPSRVEVPGYDNAMHLWMADQQVMTAAICKQPWFPAGALLVNRFGHPPIDRLDRSCQFYWQTSSFNRSKWTDAHVHKKPWCDWEWSTLLPIIDALIPQFSGWARDYRDNFVKTL